MSHLALFCCPTVFCRIPGLFFEIITLNVFVTDVTAEAQQQHPVRLRAKSPDSRTSRGPRHHVGQG